MPHRKNADKFGWLPGRFGWCRAGVVAGAAALVAVEAMAAPVAAQVISAHGDWTALRFGGQCEARSGGVRTTRGRPPALAGFAFGSARGGDGRFYVRLSRIPRAGSTAILSVGSQPFLLAVRGQWGWGRDRRQDAAIMAAARSAGSMRLESRDRGGRRYVERFSLAGAATAIDAAAAACATTGKSR